MNKYLPNPTERFPVKNLYAKRIARDYRRFFLRVMFLELPRLRRQKRLAERRGEMVEPILAEADRIGLELKKKFKLSIAARKADKMLNKAGWQ